MRIQEEKVELPKKTQKNLCEGHDFFICAPSLLRNFLLLFVATLILGKKKYFAPGNGRSRRDDAPCPQCLRQCLRVCKRKFHDIVIRSSALGLRLESVLRKNNHFP